MPIKEYKLEANQFGPRTFRVPEDAISKFLLDIVVYGQQAVQAAARHGAAHGQRGAAVQPPATWPGQPAAPSTAVRLSKNRCRYPSAWWRD